MARKTRTDSTTGIVEAVKSSFEVIDVPDHITLCEKGKIYWSEIMDMRSKSEWTSHDLSYAGMLAKTMAMADSERDKLEEEGAILISDKGSPFSNPRATVLHGYESRIKSMRQSLNIHGRARLGEARDQAGRSIKNRQTVEGFQSAFPSGDGLLAN